VAYTLVHVSDLHLLADGLLFGEVDCEEHLRRFASRVVASGVRPDAIVVTGDVADQAESGAYVRARAVLDPLAESLGCPVVWVMGNHDHRVVFREHLLGDDLTNRVVNVGGLRLVALDSTRPGYHHGHLDAATLGWLHEVLSVPAPDGTVLALHHPPLETNLAFLRFLDLRNRDELADVVRGTDVRVVLAGHWHLSAIGTWAGVSVLVAGATSYSTDPAAPSGSFAGVDHAQSYRLIELHDGGLTSSVVPIAAQPVVVTVSAADLTAAEDLAPADRDERWSRFPVTDLPPA
jgi:3',5'-cyclic-AMP phosphodiesterase